MSYARKRYFVYAFITLFTLVVPFVTINGNHLLLLSFDKLQFHLLGSAFDVNEFFVMSYLLMFFFIGIFALTTMFGRVWCGWICPQTIFRVIYRDLIEGTLLDLRSIKNKQRSINYSKKKNNLAKVFSLALWGLLTLIISTNFMWYFVPPEDFFVYLQNPAEHIFMIAFVLSTAAFLFFDIVVIKENFCMYVCPYSMIQSVLYDDDTKHVVYDTNRGGAVYAGGEKSVTDVQQWFGEEECTTCEACVKVCPTHIDIRKGLQLECINCLECSDACTTVMKKLGKAPLINWGSNHSVLQKLQRSLFSKRNISYMVTLILSLMFATLYASQKESLLVNVNKPTQLYRIHENGRVSNSYVVAVHNLESSSYTYDISVEDKERFRIKRFKPFSVEGQKRLKKILIIETKERLLLSERRDSVLPMKMTVFAKEDPTIKQTIKVAFIHPRNDLIR